MARQWPQLSKSLADFFSRSWFTRAWLVQKVTLRLVDADGIYSHDPIHEAIPKVQQCCMKVCPNSVFTIVDQDRLRAAYRTPCIG
jgi:hypothetical protein